MSPVEQKPDNNPVGLFEKFLLWLERTGNKLPDPLTIFATLAAVVLVISLIGSVAGFSAIHPLTKKTIETVNLLSVPGLQQMISMQSATSYGFPRSASCWLRSWRRPGGEDWAFFRFAAQDIGRQKRQ